LLADQAPDWVPGTEPGYHSNTFGYLVGEVVRRVTGRSLGTVFRQEIAEPMGADFYIGLPASEDARVADLIPPPGPPDRHVSVDVMRTRTREWRGAEIPAIGFGTGSLGANAAEAVAAALRLGYRHLDAARKYGTERGVGDGMRASAVPRADIFLTTKVSHESLRPSDFARSVETSLRELQVDYIDLLLIHWPNPQIPVADCMGPLAEAKRHGLARHIGVANFTARLLDEAIRACPEPLVTNQVECHPYLDQTAVLAACRRHGMVLTAHCPLARGRLIGDPVLNEIAQAKQRTVAQVALRWLIEQDIIAAMSGGTFLSIPLADIPGGVVLLNGAALDFAVLAQIQG
jgi:diketogulonate reductase-like aldo/keto reductase